jgi:hypothetical protein
MLELEVIPEVQRRHHQTVAECQLLGNYLELVAQLYHVDAMAGETVHLVATHKL